MNNHEFKAGDRVAVRYFLAGNGMVQRLPIPVCGTVVRKICNLEYEVQIDDGSPVRTVVPGMERLNREAKEET